MRITNLTVGLEMRRSNGDYGSDKAETTVHAELERGEDPELSLRIMLDLARAQCEADLSRSPSLTVRRGVLPEYRSCSRCRERLPDDERSYMHPACKEAEDAEREARHQELKAQRDRENAEQWALSNANAEERELVGVAAAEGDDDEDEDL